ncbi:biotin/lipoyl-binding carrier protein [Euzebya sp.]|uniref:biotin/lipoyl-binding carrier protein n=1 Tax=Euzebya sp. TaxID=1971409 RepID=UPI003518002F
MAETPTPRTLSVTTEIVASVLRIEVAPGDRVHAGQTLLVLESMKMEMPIDSPADGEVIRVAVAVGDVVQEGDELAELRL